MMVGTVVLWMQTQIPVLFVSANNLATAAAWSWTEMGDIRLRIFLNYELVASWVVDIWVSSTSFQKSNIGWPQQPLKEKVLISAKNWIFDDTFYKKRSALVILVPGMIQPSGSVFFWWNEAFEVIEAIEVVEAVEVMEAEEVLMPGKSLLRTFDPSMLLNTALFGCFEKKSFG